MEKLSYVDQEAGSEVLQFITDTGRVIDVQQDAVLDFIELNSLNISNEGTGMTCDPNGTDHLVVIDSTCYLDNNFDAVCAEYFQIILVPNILKHVA